MYCTNHPAKEAFESCISCEKAYCHECLTIVKKEQLCRSDVKVVKKKKLKPAGTGKVDFLIPTKNRSLAALLAFLLGWLGIHKFYLDQKVTGIIYLLFCWTGIPLIVSIAEGISYLLCSDHNFACKYGGQVV